MAKKRRSSNYPKKYRRKTKRRTIKRKKSRYSRKRQKKTKQRGGGDSEPSEIPMIMAKLGKNVGGKGIGVSPHNPGGLAVATQDIYEVLSGNFEVTEYNSSEKLGIIEGLIKEYMIDLGENREIYDPLYCLIMDDPQTWLEWTLDNIWSGGLPEPKNINVSLVDHLKQKLS
jgi:hypothetical protein